MVKNFKKFENNFNYTPNYQNWSKKNIDQHLINSRHYAAAHYQSLEEVPGAGKNSKN